MENYFFLIAQILGCVALIVSIISLAQKSRSRYIIYNILQNIFSAVQYLFLFKFIAFYLCILSIVRLVVYRFKHKYSNWLYVLILIIFVSLNIIISLLNFTNWFDLLPLIASTLVCFTVWQSNVTVIRYGLLISKILWGIFAVISLAYFSIAMDIILIIWSIIIIVRDDKLIKS